MLFTLFIVCVINFFVAFILLDDVVLFPHLLHLGVDGLCHRVHNGEHHGGGGGVGDPHGQEHGGEHEPQHQPGLASPNLHP